MSADTSDDELELTWAKAVDYPDCRVVTLWWQEVKLTEPEDIGKAIALANAVTDIPRTGLYAFEGFRDGAPGREILYIGQCGANGGVEDGTSKQPLGDRLAQSFRKLSYGKGPTYFFSDVWDITVRFAHLDPAHIRGIEAVLVHAHAPPFNAQHVRGVVLQNDNYLVLNAGRKGTLLPVAASLYYRTDCWLDPPG